MNIREIPCSLCGRLVPFVPSPCDGVSALCSICSSKLRKRERK